MYFSYRKYKCYKNYCRPCWFSCWYSATQVVFENCAPFKDCRIETNDTFVDYADFINVAMPMYNLIKYSDNYSYTLEVYGVLKNMT